MFYAFDKEGDVMKKLLHIIATPREEESRTLKVSKAFVHEFQMVHTDWQIEELNVFNESLPELNVERIAGKYKLLVGNELNAQENKAWEKLLAYIEQFKAADAYLISTPMWNFSLPYKLKHYIDLIVQPRYMFTYTAEGPQGLLKGKKMFVINSCGGNYSLEETKSLDYVEPYLRTVFGLVGISDIHFVKVQPMDAMGLEVQENKIVQAKQEAKDLVRHV